MIKLNLLPKKLRKRVEPGWWRLAAIIFPLIVFTILAVMYLNTSTQIAQLEQQREQLAAEVKTLQPYIRKQRELNRRKTELEQIINVDRQIRAKFIPWSDRIAQFINQIPRRDGRFEVFLRSINTRLVPEDKRSALIEQGLYDRKPVSVELNLQGEALDDKALARFVEAFENSPNFGINFQQGTLNANGGYDFTATVGIVASNAEAQGGEQGAR